MQLAYLQSLRDHQAAPPPGGGEGEGMSDEDLRAVMEMGLRELELAQLTSQHEEPPMAQPAATSAHGPEAILAHGARGSGGQRLGGAEGVLDRMRDMNRQYVQHRMSMWRMHGGGVPDVQRDEAARRLLEQVCMFVSVGGVEGVRGMLELVLFVCSCWCACFWSRSSLRALARAHAAGLDSVGRWRWRWKDCSSSSLSFSLSRALSLVLSLCLFRCLSFSLPLSNTRTHTRTLEQSERMEMDMERLQRLLHSRGFQSVLSPNGFMGMDYEALSNLEVSLSVSVSGSLSVPSCDSLFSPSYSSYYRC
jgi:hypothetical protein